MQENQEIEQKEQDSGQEDKKHTKTHWIKNKWLRISLKVFGWVLLFVMLLPVLVYVPPVQTFLKDIACKMVNSSTGMNISIDRFRLRFPLDVTLEGVKVIEEKGDTMAMAGKALVDLKLMPLFKLDVEVKNLLLKDAYYRMLSADSSMIMKIRAGEFETGAGTSVSIAGSEINLDKARLAHGNVSLYMNVWKKKPVPEEKNTSESKPFVIKVGNLDLEDFSFGMSMLPTIDTLDIKANSGKIENASVNLRNNTIKASLLALDSGSAKYITPTAEYIKTHPAPPSEPSDGPPMTIVGDSVSLTGFNALYATKGVKPMPGFDAGYIEIKDVNLALKDFYNQSSTVRLPLTRLEAKERCGLEITEGRGTVEIDSVGLGLDKLNLRTPYSKISADAFISFGMMAMERTAPVDINARMSIGPADVRNFMPSLAGWLKMLPTTREITADIEASGSLSSLNVPLLKINVPSLVSLSAKGSVDNPMDLNKMKALLDIDGKLTNADPVLKLAGVKDFSLPPLSIKGTAGVNAGTYSANINMLTVDGGVAAVGKVSLNSESYNADLDVRNLDIRRFMPSLGLGMVSASIKADGAGFNPLRPGSSTDLQLDISRLEYNNINLKDVTGNVSLHNGEFELDLDSRTPALNGTITGYGTIAEDDYSFDITANLIDVDLVVLGFSKTSNNGAADIHVSGTASPAKSLYDVALDIDNVQWNLNEHLITMPGGLRADFTAESDFVKFQADAMKLYMDFTSTSGLDPLLASFTKSSEIISRQIDAKRIAVDSLKEVLPQFDFNLNASGRGVLGGFLAAQGMSADTLSLHLENREQIQGLLATRNFNMGSFQMDTVNFSIKERGSLLDYRTHIGNRPSTMGGDFASVDLNGYVGGNRALLSLTQKNSKGETGYRLGVTAAFMDENIDLHFTPLKATIAYLPWQFNDDNYIEYYYTGRINANLKASSNESSVLLLTEKDDEGDDMLHVDIENLKIEDFLKMSVTAPPVSGSLNAEMDISYKGNAFKGDGTVKFNDFRYDRKKVGDFELGLNAYLADAGETGIKADLSVNGRKALTGTGILRNDSTGKAEPMEIDLSLQKFPLTIANAFLDKNMAQLIGSVSGELSMKGSMAAPKLDGELICDSASVSIPMAGTQLSLDDKPLVMKGNILTFDDFRIMAANKNPLTINGSVNAVKLNDISMDLALRANDYMLINSKKKRSSEIYGKLLMNLNAKAKGPVSSLDVNANIGILSGTDIYYVMPATTAELAQTSTQDVVKFVQFSDTTAIQNKDTVATSPVHMRISAALNISNGVQATAILSPNGTDKVQLTPTGSLNYFQNFMGDMRLNGQLNIGDGFVRYSVPMIGELMFTFQPDSYVLWNGAVMNPVLNISGVDVIKTVVKDDSGNSRLVNFLVTLAVTNTLERPKVVFDLSTDDDLTIENELQSMSADQRSTQAMNLLLYGHYEGANTKTQSGGADAMLYSFLESKLNSWAANNIKGVDLSFGIDQFDQTRDGRSTSSMTYSYQVSKSLFNNRFKIVVGGNYNTDPSTDENFAENLFSDVSFEYMLRQTNTMSMYVKLFRHIGFESVLEGEITEMGVGFVMRRKISNIKRLFRFLQRKRKKHEQVISPPEEHRDSVAPAKDAFYKIELPSHINDED